MSDTVAARASYFVYQGHGGPYRDLFNGGHYGEPNQLAGRLQLLWKGEDSKLKLSAYGFRDKSELTPYKSPGIFTAGGAFCPQILAGTIDKDRTACLRFGSQVPGADPSGLRETQSIRELNSDVQWLANNSAYGTSARFEHDFGGATLTSITSYDYFKRAQTEDGDNTPYQTANEYFYSRIKQFSQELRLGGKTGNLNYLVGGFFEQDSIDEVNASVSLNSLAGLPPFAPRLGAEFTQKVRSIAAFTHNEYEVAPGLSIVAGIRYTNDRNKLDAVTFLGANDPVGKKQRVTQVIPVDALVDQRTDENVSFRGGVNWHPADGHLIYGSVSRGFRSGGYSVPFGGAITTFSPERLTAYEGGYKGRLLDKTLDLSVSGFYYDYKNLQVNVDDPLSPLVPITRNIGASRNWGIEGDLAWHPDNSFIVRAGVGYLNAKFTDTDRLVTTYAGAIPLEGKRPVNTPKLSGQIFVQKSFPVGDDMKIIAQTDGKYTGSRFLEATNQPFDRAESYWLQNARLTLEGSGGQWEVALWGRNIFNKEYLTYINNIIFFRLEIYGEPAAYGLSTTIRF